MEEKKFKEVQLQLLRRQRKSDLQRKARGADTDSKAKAAMEETAAKNVRRADAVLDDFERQEADLAATAHRAKELEDNLKEMEKRCAELEAKVKNPSPAFDFGAKGTKWDYRVFGLACELLSVRLTATQCFRVTEIFLRFMYPGHAVRVPSKEMFAKWRTMMYRIVKYVNVKCASKLDVGHVGAGESRKGGVSILGVILRIVKGERAQDVMLDCAIVEDQTAEVEFRAMLSSFTAQIGEWVVEVPVGRIVSAISDNAPGAKKVSDLFGAYKKRRYEELSIPEKDALSDEEKENWQAWDGLKCEMHKMALAAQHFVGGCVLSDEDKEAQKNYNPDKAAMVHGSVEYAVQRRLSAFGAMKRFWEHVEGHCAVHGERDIPAFATVGVVPGTIIDPAVVMTPSCFDLTSPPSLWRLAACRYAFNRIQAFQVRPHLYSSGRQEGA